MLIARKANAKRVAAGWWRPLPGQSGGGMDRRAFLRRSGLTAGSLAALGTLPLGGIRKAEAAGPRAGQRHHPAEHVHPLFGRLYRDGRSGERRLGRAGARLEQSHQSRLALRQGRRHPRDCPWRSASALPDEDRRWPVAAHFLGYGDQRDRRQVAGDPRESRPDSVYWLGLGQIHQ